MLAKVRSQQPSIRCSSTGGTGGGGSSAGGGGGGGGGGGDSGSGGGLWATYLRLLETQPASRLLCLQFLSHAVILQVTLPCKYCSACSWHIAALLQALPG